MDQAISYVEPVDHAEICAELAPPRWCGRTLGPSELQDRIDGAWLGRCAGSCLGQPVADGGHWLPEQLRQLLRRTHNHPIDDYLVRPDSMPAGLEFGPGWTEATKGRIRWVPRSDALDHAVLALYLLETHGAEFTTAHLADAWLARLPIGLVGGAEQVAYRNLVDGMGSTEAGTLANPHGEWHGALVRGGSYGYVCAGHPRAAALLALRDAALSHTGNGRYAGMWAAALVAAAFNAISLRSAVAESIGHVPQRSRLAEVLHWAAEVAETGPWTVAVDALHDRFEAYDWRHALPNAASCALALSYAGDEFTRAIGLAVEAGFAASANAATVGSVAGAFAGRAGVPPHWTAPFGDTLRTGLSGMDRLSLRELGRRTYTVSCQITTKNS